MLVSLALCSLLAAAAAAATVAPAKLDLGNSLLVPRSNVTSKPIPPSSSAVSPSSHPPQSSDPQSFSVASTPTSTKSFPSPAASSPVSLVTQFVTQQGVVQTLAHTPSPEATLSTPSSSTASSGISAKTRNTVIGITVGIGGAALLAIIAIVSWRIKSHKEEPESVHSSPEIDRFKDAVDQYHRPRTLNPSSNF
ncbi:hypothetical protein NEOLI_004954 [Neolecta irregularis DAH-3]|uniref:Mid2 domain-containing protein n=1 Tax=Neolecta irregularis (strain DAH-3) TaxID=1198029 RepID=A0A1U7LKX0_NEOID|nr:hypothetical protein NEOLI_004954 [Neolecta irregularis DAH-3]|eukprot:OLL23243.1 hypothetical protein NEOLI_004954 [Neolecta irregularis DAH-3]